MSAMVAVCNFVNLKAVSLFFVLGVWPVLKVHVLKVAICECTETEVIVLF